MPFDPKYNFPQVASDIRRADKLEMALYGISQLGTLSHDEMLEIVRALDKQSDGDTSVVMQECKEALIADLPKPVTVDHAEPAMQSLQHFQG